MGVVAEGDGLFALAGAQLSRLPVGGRVLLVVALALVAVVTAVLNLDTAVFFLTPVLLHLARHRAVDERPYLYGAIFMANSASLFLPGSNLTNLIVLHSEHVSGAQFFARTWAAAIASVVATTVVLLGVFWRPLGERGSPAATEHALVRLGPGAVAVAVSTVLVLVLAAPALPVLLVGIAAVLVARTSRDSVLSAVDVRAIGALFVLAVALGALGRWWDGPHALFDTLGRWPTAGLGALFAIGLNNLPAAVLLTPEPPAHARALLLGLNIGPNLAVTGSLSALLWLRVARSLGAHPSIRTFSLIGVLLVPVTLVAALAASSL